MVMNMKTDENCLFCRIVSGKVPSAKVYEDERIIAFLDISPVNEGHTLVVPKSHSRNMLEDNIDDLKAIMQAVQYVAKAVMQATGAGGFNLMVNTNREAGQVVYHTHFHIVPRHENDGFKHWPGKNMSESQLETVKNKIVESLM
jgi:histidine triad (HIT) family protein